MDRTKLEIDIKNRAEIIYAKLLSDLKLSSSQYKLDFVIFENLDINGRAKRIGNIDYIEINSGVFDEFLNYFSVVNKYFLKEVLQILLPDMDEEMIDSITMEGVTYSNGNLSIFDSKLIVDERTNLLEIFLVRFILLHELGHIFNGHCDLLNEKGYLDYMPMNFDMYENINKEDKVEISEIDIRTMEMDADSFAATQSFLHLCMLYSNYEDQVHCRELEPLDLFYWWSFAIRSHFLLMEDRYPKKQIYSPNLKHLPSCARSAMIINVMLDLCNNLQPNIQEECKMKLYFGAEKAEKVFNELKYTSYSLLDHIHRKDYKEYSDEVNSRWDKLSVELKKYSRAPLFE